MDQGTSSLAQVSTEQVLGPEASVLVLGRKGSFFPVSNEATALHMTSELRQMVGL